MSHQPRRLMDDPDWGEAFQSYAGEQEPMSGMPSDVRAEVAAMIAASVAGAAGLAAGLATATSVASTSSVVGGGAVGGGASTVVVGTSAGGGALVGGGAVAGGGAAVVGGGAAVVGGGASGVVASGVVASSVAAGGAAVAGTTGFGAAGAVLASMGIAPKVIAAISLVGAMTAGGAVVVEHGGLGARVFESDQVSGGEASRVPVAGLAQPDREVRAHRNSLEPQQPTVPDDGGSTDLGLAEAQQSAALPADRTIGAASPGAASPDAAAEASPVIPKKAVAPVRLGLADEVALLRKVRASLTRDPETAWRYLNTYNRRYPAGDLRAEYEQLVARAQSGERVLDE